MKKCDQFRDMILTDFVDGELDKHSGALLEAHLLDCQACRVFLKDVKVSAVTPFKEHTPQPVPSELWVAVAKRIEEEKAAFHPLQQIGQVFRGLLVFPRLVPVLATFVVMFLAGSVTLNTIQLQQQAMETDQGAYMVSLLTPTETASEGNGGESAIEHYFL